MLSNALFIIFVYITSRSLTPFLNELKSSCHLDAFTSKILSLSAPLILYKCFPKLNFISSKLSSISYPLLPPNYGIWLPAPFLANYNYPSQISNNSLHLDINASTYANILLLKSHFPPFYNNDYLSIATDIL